MSDGIPDDVMALAKAAERDVFSPDDTGTITSIIARAIMADRSSRPAAPEGWPTEAQVAEAMQDAWNDICTDTGCHPVDIEQGGKAGKGVELTFQPRHWARFTAARLSVLLEQGSTTLLEDTKGTGE